MTGTVYYHKFSNGKGYIGITRKSVKERLREHRYTGSLFAKAIEKYGLDDITTILLAENVKSEEALMELEKFFIKFFNTFDRNNGYNLTEGGELVYTSTKGKTYEEILGVDRAKEKKEHMSRLFSGRIVSDETKRKMRGPRQSVTGSNNSNYEYIYVLSPTNNLYKKDVVTGETTKQFLQKNSIPSNILLNLKYSEKTVMENWVYVKKDSYDFDDNFIIKELLELKHKQWVDKSSPEYRYDHTRTRCKFISPFGEVYITDTPREFYEFCVKMNFSHEKAKQFRAGKIQIGEGSTLYGWKIIREITEI